MPEPSRDQANVVITAAIESLTAITPAEVKVADPDLLYRFGDILAERLEWRNGRYTTQEDREAFLAIRKEAGLKIDPKTAEAFWVYGSVIDPYGIYPPFEEDNIGRNCFARAPESDVWVWSGDLPEATAKAVHEKADNQKVELPW